MRQRIARWPLLAALCFEGLLIPVALVLALLLGVAPWQDLVLTPGAVLLALLGTAPLLGGLWLLASAERPALRELDALVRDLLGRLLAHARPGAVPALALLAGFGEELLFRGVLQVWLAGYMPPGWAMAIVAVVFGLAHFLNGLYFAIATMVGLYLGALYHFSGNLLVVCLVHALYDWIAIRIYLRCGGVH